MKKIQYLCGRAYYEEILAMQQANFLWKWFHYEYDTNEFLSLSLSLSLDSASILNRIKEGYFIWINIVPHISKVARYTIGFRIENKFLDLLEFSYIAYFTEKDKKVEKISDCILILDTLKFLISVAWEGKIISNKQCEDVVMKLDEVGKMFGGWKKNLNNPEKKNRNQ